MKVMPVIAMTVMREVLEPEFRQKDERWEYFLVRFQLYGLSRLLTN